MIKRKTMLAIEEKAQVDDMLTKVQRKKDLKVDTINKRYEAKIDSILRRQKELELIIKDTKEYVKNV